MRCQGKWIEVKIHSSVDGGELVSLLGDPGLLGAWQENGIIHLYWDADQWNDDTLREMNQTMRSLGQESEPSISLQAVPDRDWNAVWSASVKPLRIGRRVVIRPSWEQVEVVPSDIELVIDPKLAFGTGHHATTQLLIEWLDGAVRRGEHVLDVGTGSGILAMLALRLGAASALGIDKDEAAIACAREYAAVNCFGPELELRVHTLEGIPCPQDHLFNLILANLGRATFLEYGRLLIPLLDVGGRLFVSGILVEDQEDIAGVFTRVGGIVSRVQEREGWLALEVQFPESCGG